MFLIVFEDFRGIPMIQYINPDGKSEFFHVKKVGLNQEDPIFQEYVELTQHIAELVRNGDIYAVPYYISESIKLESKITLVNIKSLGFSDLTNFVSRCEVAVHDEKSADFSSYCLTDLVPLIVDSDLPVTPEKLFFPIKELIGDRQTQASEYYIRSKFSDKKIQFFKRENVMFAIVEEAVFEVFCHSKGDLEEFINEGSKVYNILMNKLFAEDISKHIVSFISASFFITAAETCEIFYPSPYHSEGWRFMITDLIIFSSKGSRNINLLLL